MPKLLIVDDELDVREFAKNFFTRRKIDCATASGGSEAIAVYQEFRPDLTLLDVRMQDMNGIDVLERLKSIDKDAKVIMVTGIDEEEIVRRSEELGAVGYIHKPLVLDELEKVVMEKIKD
jgi:two-component system response regulator (stage 0 sporulation protein F)